MISKKTIINAIKENYTILYKAMPEEWRHVLPIVTTDFLTECGLHFTTTHTGKMSGMVSLSTTCKTNNLCKKRIDSALKADCDCTDKKTAKRQLAKMIKEDPFRKDISICGFCFSDSQQDMFTSMEKPLAHNADILNNGIIHYDWIPALNCLYFRFESFGDFASRNSAINCVNIARKNPLVNCAAWSKNMMFFKKAILSGYGKPENLSLILSSQYINKAAKNSFDFVDRVFTVYTPEYADKYGIKINCGARSCLNCLRCYRGTENVVSELLK